MREMVCIVCPKGCKITVDDMPSALIPHPSSFSLHPSAIKGALCKRGVAYATEEITAPKRMVTTLVQVAGRRAPLPVKTAAPVPKGKIFEVLATTHSARVSAPVRIGDVIVADVCGTGVDIVATGTV